MAASFNAASTRRLDNAGVPFALYPFTMGFWVQPTTTGTLMALAAFNDTGAATEYFTVMQSAANAWYMEVSGGNSCSIGTVTANQWHYVIARLVDADSRYLTVLQANGSIVHGSPTVATRLMTSLDTVMLGAFRQNGTASSYFTGLIAEFWYSNTDISGSNTQLNDELVRQIAYSGPFSVPHIAPDVIEYRSLRIHPTANNPASDAYYRNMQPPVWTNTGGVFTGAHPPLAPDFVKPAQQAKRLLVI